MTNFAGSQVNMEALERFMFLQKLYGYQILYFITSKIYCWPIFIKYTAFLLNYNVGEAQWVVIINYANMIHEQWTQIIDMMIHYNIIRMGFFRSLFTRIRIGTSTLEHDPLCNCICMHLKFILINCARWRCDFVLRNIVLGKMRSSKIHWLQLYSNQIYICIEDLNVLLCQY